MWAASASLALRYMQTGDDRFYLAREALIRDLPPELFNPPTVTNSKTMRRRRGSVDEAVVEKDDEVTPGSQTTVWVGGLPINCADDPAALTDALKAFGKVLSVTVRRKPGYCKSWAFATFAEQASCLQAVGSGSITVEDSAGEAVAVTLKAAQVDEELKKDGTGALASTWAGQEEKNAETASGTN
eukprot:COSAG03_NODE_1034_length_4987_cov_5.503069_6_plen_185_part_00